MSLSRVLLYTSMLLVWVFVLIFLFTSPQDDKKFEPSISQSQIDVYNRRMLINCLQELKEIKGGDTYVR